MVVWLFGPISEDRSYPDKTEGCCMSLVMGAIMQEPQCLTICSGGWSFNVETQMLRQGGVKTSCETICKFCHATGMMEKWFKWLCRGKLVNLEHTICKFCHATGRMQKIVQSALQGQTGGPRATKFGR
ncbi:hypothetical protein AVEN_59744-1 [Araneus ventricosus]|uniref:Uncharacterized protein n=1 Tax=Araneus ventricosus TaxID=182803 RepID=A0A4Y2BNN9_ARAVE|nr:hypothetical protein AVEN_59744-1 [Araneus ventricosus]